MPFMNLRLCNSHLQRKPDHYRIDDTPTTESTGNPYMNHIVDMDVDVETEVATDVIDEEFELTDGNFFFL